MLNYNQPIKEEKSYQGLQISGINPIMKLIIRGKNREFLSAAGKSLDMVLPTKANTSTQSEKLTALWLSPDEWMIFSNDVVKKNTNSYEIPTLKKPDNIIRSGFKILWFVYFTLDQNDQDALPCSKRQQNH